MNEWAPYPLPSGHPEFSLPAFREEDVLRHLQRLPRHKATDSPWVSDCVLHETGIFIAPSLTYIFNLSLNTLAFLHSWKPAVICPLFKNRGSRQDPGNYRPVCLQWAVDKTMDAFLSQRLCRYVASEKLISNHQFGFLPGRSTITQLVYVYLTDQLIKALDNRCSTVTVFMDFMKAFWHRNYFIVTIICEYKIFRFGDCDDFAGTSTKFLRFHEVELNFAISRSQR